MEIKSRKNELYSQRVDFPYGHHRNPMTSEDLIAKFRDCLSFSPKPISEKAVDKIISKIMSLEEVSNVRDILRLLS